MKHGGAATYNFVYIEDVAGCIASALESGVPGLYNVSSGESTSVRQLAESVARLHRGRAVRVLVEPGVGTGASGFAAISIEKARRTWGYRPLSLDQGLTRYRDALK